MIPSKFLKISAGIAAYSLTPIFKKSILTEIFPTDWKLARVTPALKKKKKVHNQILITMARYLLYRWPQKLLRKLSTTNCTNI